MRKIVKSSKMLSIKTLTFILALLVPAFASKDALRARELMKTCDTLKACYLVNIKTRKETELDGFDSFQIDPTNEQGYTIRCDVSGNQTLNFIKFLYNNTVHDEFGVPRYMDGDAGRGRFLNRVEYVSTCGRKYVTIEGHIWSSMCFTKTYIINARNPRGRKCGSPSAYRPVKAPVNAPVNAPVKPPVDAPIESPVRAFDEAPALVCKPEISGFTLVDADNDEDIMSLDDFYYTDAMRNIRANVAVCDPEVVDSVMLVLDGDSRCERHRPYSVFADDSSTDVSNDAAQYNGRIIGVGTHVITATPFTGPRCDGTAGDVFTQVFTVESRAD